jgi:hypothetical protein
MFRNNGIYSTSTKKAGIVAAMKDVKPFTLPKKGYELQTLE